MHAGALASSASSGQCSLAPGVLVRILSVFYPLRNDSSDLVCDGLMPRK